MCCFNNYNNHDRLANITEKDLCYLRRLMGQTKFRICLESADSFSTMIQPIRFDAKNTILMRIKLSSMKEILFENLLTKAAYLDALIGYQLFNGSPRVANSQYEPSGIMCSASNNHSRARLLEALHRVSSIIHCSDLSEYSIIDGSYDEFAVPWEVLNASVAEVICQS